MEAVDPVRFRIALALLIGATTVGCARPATPPTLGPAAAYTAFRQAAEAYLAVDRGHVAQIGAAHLAGDRSGAVELAGRAVADYEKQLETLRGLPVADCFREGRDDGIAAVAATLAQVRGWAGGALLADPEAEGFYRRYELKPQWKHTLDSEAVGCGAD